MELDQLKNIWDNEKVNETPEISTEKQKEIHLPLEQIRKNMRMEFWSSVIAILFILIVIPFYFDDIKMKFYFTILTLSMVIVTIFYFTKFFNLYKEISKQSFNTREMLRDLNHQFDLNQQYYLSYYIAYIPFIIASYIIIFDNSSFYREMNGFTFIVFLSLMIIGALLAFYFIGKWWFKKYYGKYISQISQISADLK